MGPGPPGTVDDHDRGPVRLEAGHTGVVRAKQPPDFLGDGREDLGRLYPPGHQRGHPAQRSLLLGQLTQPCLVRRITARPRAGGAAHIGAGVWRVHTADGSPMPGGLVEATRQAAVAREPVGPIGEPSLAGP
jgi:hypothetical protein